MPRPPNTPSVLWARVDKRGPDECWPWKGWTNLGYGRVQIGEGTYYAHRVIYNLAYPGRITLEAPRSREESGWLLHICDNPICCNPNHLVVGTHQDNMTDKAKKGRAVWWDGSVGTPRAKLSADDVRSIREERKRGVPRKILAERYGVSVVTIKGVISGRHYKDVT